MNKDKELRLYELLGVNVFRKYVLFTWEKIAKFIHLPIGYRIDEYSTTGFKFYQIKAIAFAIAHSGLLAYTIVDCILSSSPIWNYWLSILLNSYCIMTQRYNYIRIGKILERKKQRDARIKKQKEEKVIEKDDSLTLEKELHNGINKPSFISNKIYEEEHLPVVEETSRVLKKVR